MPTYRIVYTATSSASVLSTFLWAPPCKCEGRAQPGDLSMQIPQTGSVCVLNSSCTGYLKHRSCVPHCDTGLSAASGSPAAVAPHKVGSSTVHTGCLHVHVLSHVLTAACTAFDLLTYRTANGDLTDIQEVGSVKMCNTYLQHNHNLTPYLVSQNGNHMGSTSSAAQQGIISSAD